MTDIQVKRGKAIPLQFFMLFMWFACSMAQADALRFIGGEFPFILETQDGKPSGLAVEVIKEVARRSGIDYTITVVPWARAQALMQSGRADILIGPYRTREREQQLTFIRWPLYIDTMSWYANTESNYQWDGNFSSLSRLRLGVTRGWTLGQRYEASKRRLQIETADSIEQNFGKLLLGRLDLVACNERTAQAASRRMPPRQSIRPLTPPITRIGGYFAYGRTAPVDPRIVEFESALGQIVRSGKLYALSRQAGLFYPAPDTRWDGYLTELP